MELLNRHGYSHALLCSALLCSALLEHMCGNIYVICHDFANPFFANFPYIIAQKYYSTLLQSSSNTSSGKENQAG